MQLQYNTTLTERARALLEELEAEAREKGWVCRKLYAERGPEGIYIPHEVVVSYNPSYGYQYCTTDGWGNLRLAGEFLVRTPGVGPEAREAARRHIEWCLRAAAREGCHGS